MSSVQEALKAREERKKKEQEKNSFEASKNRIDSAVETYKKRKQSNSQSAVSDIASRIKSEVEAIQKVEMPSWGEGTFRSTMDSTRESTVNIGNLQRELEAYKSYIDE